MSIETKLLYGYRSLFKFILEEKLLKPSHVKRALILYFLKLGPFANFMTYWSDLRSWNINLLKGAGTT